jgi:hypothetical protein
MAMAMAMVGLVMKKDDVCLDGLEHEKYCSGFFVP